MLDLQLLSQVNEIATEAGAQILSIYNSDEPLAVNRKQDDSPITQADRLAHSLIVERLEKLTPDVPLLSEESDGDVFSKRKSWSRYWLIDPLDGTKEFIDRNGEFTVNIALVEDGRAIGGVVHVPVSGDSYFGGLGIGAWKSEEKGAGEREIRCRAMSERDEVSVVASRRHHNCELDAMLEALGNQFADVSLVSMGSSLKMCLLAEGSADIYPRLAPTSEWDTAAAHAILCAAGGDIVDLEFKPLRYNQRDTLLNPHFIALADTDYPWQRLLDKQ